MTSSAAASRQDTVEDVTRVCDEAGRAVDPYRDTDRERRAAFLEAIGAQIVALGDGLIDTAVAESGLPRGRIEGERGRTVGQLKLFAEVLRAGRWEGVRIDPALPERQPAPRPDRRLRMIPLGPVAVFGAANFPLAFSTAGGDTAPALAAGCPVIVKGHPAHPHTDGARGRPRRRRDCPCRHRERHAGGDVRTCRRSRQRARHGAGRQPADRGGRLHRLARGQAALFETGGAAFLADRALEHEVFGAASLLVRCRDLEALRQVVEVAEGQLTATLQMDAADEPLACDLLPVLERKAGRILANGWPTGVEVSHAMVHGGPFPATSDARTTSVGSPAIDRFLHPVSDQSLPATLLPPVLRDDAQGPRLIDGTYRA